MSYFFVHGCSDQDDSHHEACDGLLVWAGDTAAALAVAERYLPNVEPEHLTTYPDPEAGTVHLGDVLLLADAGLCTKCPQCKGAAPDDCPGCRGFGRVARTPAVDRIWRKANFREEGAPTCETCGLPQWYSLPESKVCDACCTCLECAPAAEHAECEEDP